MLNDADNIKQEPVRLRSRRRFTKWIGEVVAGTSLVAIGISFIKPSNVAACTPCAYCVKTLCCCTGGCSGCPANAPCGYYYDYYKGCAVSGRCQGTYQYSDEKCVANCNGSGCP